MEISHKTRLDQIDLLRGIASLAVVLVHYCGLGFLGENSLLTKIFFHGTYGVHLFFVISGMVIPFSLFNSNYNLNLKDFLKFLLKRFIRISLPYYVAVLMICIQHYLTGYEGPTYKFETARLLNHFTYTIPFTHFKFFDPVFWSLSIEFQFYIVIALLYPLVINKNKTIAIITYFLSLASCLFTFKYSSALVFHYSPLFILGILLFLNHCLLISRTSLYLFSLGAFLICFYHLGVPITLASIFGFIFIQFSKFRSKTTSFMGEISYSVYLTHNFFRLFYFIFIAHFMPDLTVPFKLLFMLFAISLTLFFGWLFYLFVEKPSLYITSLIGKIKWFKN